MNWFFTLVRMAGTMSPLSATLVQLQAELDAAQFRERLRKLEDPISQLDPGVPKLAEVLFARLRVAPSNTIDLDRSEVAKFSRPLNALEAAGLLRGNHSSQGRFSLGLLVSPMFLVYMCERFEDPEKMDVLTSIVDSCRGTQIRVQSVMKETGLSYPIVIGVFKLFEAKGYGTVGRQVGNNQVLSGQGVMAAQSHRAFE